MCIDYKVPFYPNTEDNTHCFQAALKMVIKYFQSNRELSWEELEKLTGKKGNLWTWPLATIVWMKNQGYEVIDIEMFDYKEFVKDKEKYLLRFYGNEVGNEQIKHSDVTQEVKYAKQLIKTNLVTKDVPTIQTIKGLLEEKYLMICLVNSHKLNSKEGYVGHFVVVKGIEENNLIIHDPGLPPLENRKISIHDFEQAWSVPDVNAKNVLAFRFT